jgi:hypothetical protein
LITGELALGEAPLLPPVERRVDLAKFVTLNPAVRLLNEAAARSAGHSVSPSLSAGPG